MSQSPKALCGWCSLQWRPVRHGRGGNRKSHTARRKKHTPRDTCPPLHESCYQKEYKTKVQRVCFCFGADLYLVVWQKRHAADPTETPDTAPGQRQRKAARPSREHAVATGVPPSDGAQSASTSTPPLHIPTPTVGSAAASKTTIRRRSALAEQVFDRIAVAPDHRSDTAAANADRVAQLKSLATRNPQLFTEATGAAKIDSQKLSPSLQLTLINLMKCV
jgi:hypothetical protein